MINSGWTEEEEEIFNPKRALTKYFSNRGLLRNYHGTSKQEEFNTFYASLTEQTLKQFIEKHRKFFARNIDPEKLAKKIAKELTDEMTKL